MQKQQTEYEVILSGIPDFNLIPDSALQPLIDELLIGLKKYLRENHNSDEE